MGETTLSAGSVSLRRRGRLASIGAWLALAAGLLLAPGAGAGLGDLFGGQRADDILPVQEAFPFRAEVVAPNRIEATWDTREGYYLYKDKLGFSLGEGAPAVVSLDLPEAKVKDDPYFGRLQVYTHPVTAVLHLDRPLTEGTVLSARYQGCAEAGLCYPPETVEYALAGVTAAAAPAAGGGPGGGTPAGGGAGSLFPGGEALSGVLAGGSTLQILAAFFGAGLLLSFTACLYPMIPIVSGLIAGDRKRSGGGRAFLLSLVYVEASAITYALAGTAAGLTGEAVQAELQSPWVLGAFASVFVVLALSMFGLFTLQLPSNWQTRLTEASHHQKGGTFYGAAVMGALSSLIVGACSGPALVAALVFISATGDALLGGLALFVLANGMGLPLLLIGTAAGKWLPRAGGWMVTVRRVFGVGFLAVALWMVDRLVDPSLSLALWGVLILGCGVFLGGLDQLRPDSGGWLRARRAGGLALLIWGSVALVGAASGGRDLFNPLHPLVAGGGAPVRSVESLDFRAVKTVADLEHQLDAARAQGRPVMLDVYADWCVYCVQLDEETFSDVRVQRMLDSALLLRADVTANDARDKALLKRLGVFLPPAVLFYPATGTEQRDARVVGFLGPERFLERARNALFGTELANR